MKNLLLFLTLLLSLIFNAQKIKLSDFKLVAYDIEAKDISILSYSTLDKNGKLNVYLKRYQDTVFYSYQLTNEEIEKVNQLFSGKLQDFVIHKELEKDTYYAGNRNYINFKVKDNNEKLCFIPPFMALRFNEIIDLLKEKIYKQDESARISEFKINFEHIKKDILKQSEIDNYLPPKNNPPLRKAS
ncbi:hypothetical protein JET18_16700 [Chryseobacterium sp. L7]|uniref:Uncharacterized protein n=1 Tax=Chryseobacterium endalhagicum TaxID=2797638 RepID=A0ABS1QIQ5_9FLAO|nr:hypothetical protein [Chryseobacterium endalhagicum]MBL1222494.1 hypothetical protein [Chryseobacterium endalhagicum]